MADGREIDPGMSGEADREHEQDWNEESDRRIPEFDTRIHAENVESENSFAESGCPTSTTKLSRQESRRNGCKFLRTNKKLSDEIRPARSEKFTTLLSLSDLSSIPELSKSSETRFMAEAGKSAKKSDGNPRQVSFPRKL